MPAAPRPERRPPPGTTAPAGRPLWACPDCGRTFANRNQTHTCGRRRLEDHLAGRSALALALFDRFRELVERCGPVEVLPEKTRIAFHVRMSFAAVTLRRAGLDGHVVLARRYEHPRFHRIDSISRRNHVHHFRILALDELDGEVAAWLAEAYRVGEQRHLAAPPP
jgi:Domain of unknown function (DUF5655)